MTPEEIQQRIEQHDREIADMRVILNQTVQLQQINAQQLGELRAIVFANQEQIARNTEAISQNEQR